jgi:hypothetical protein
MLLSWSNFGDLHTQAGASLYITVTDLINALTGNSSVNTVQHNNRTMGSLQPVARQKPSKHLPKHVPCNNGGSCVFYVVTSPTIWDLCFMGVVRAEGL